MYMRIDDIVWKCRIQSDFSFIYLCRYITVYVNDTDTFPLAFPGIRLFTTHIDIYIEVYFIHI